MKEISANVEDDATILLISARSPNYRSSKKSPTISKQWGISKKKDLMAI